MRHLDLFSGIGGFALAANWVWQEEHEIVAFIEQDKYCQKVLNKHWPEVPIIEDIRRFNGKKFTGSIDILTGGFPCQPFSSAGKQRGKEDDRYLWPEMFRVIQETRPAWIIGENVAGIINLGLETTITDLEAEGYEVEIFVLPACSVGAWHKRDRVWIIANADVRHKRASKIRFSQEFNDCSKKEVRTKKRHRPRNLRETLPHTECIRQQRQGKYERCYGYTKNKKGQTDRIKHSSKINKIQWDIEPNVGRMANGIPNRVDKLRALGNAIVPQVAEKIMIAIKEIND